MKKSLFYLCFWACSLGLFTACSDDEEPSWQKLPTETISADNLELTLNSQKMSDASVSLTMSDAQTGVLTLTNAIRGWNEVKVDVSVAEQSDGSFRFQGTYEMPLTRTLLNSMKADVNGSITLDGKASVTVSTTAEGTLVRTWTLCDASYTDKYFDRNADGVLDSQDWFRYAPCHINWESDYSSDGNNPGLATGNITTVGTTALSYFMTQLLNHVTFNADGSIVAEYAAETPQMDMGGIMQAVFESTLPSRDGLKWNTSSANLAYWYVTDNDLYVVLDIPNIIAQAVADQGGEGGMDPTVITGVIQSLKGMSGAEVKQLLASLLTEMGGDSILSKLDITKISDADMEKLMGYVFNGFPLVHRIDNANFEDGQTLENMYVSVDKELFDILMPAVFPLLPDLETMLADMQIEIFGQSAPLLLLLKGLLGIQSLTEFEQIWEATSSFDIGLDLAVGSFSELIKAQSSK